jgi:hypothetical protein
MDKRTAISLPVTAGSSVDPCREPAEARLRRAAVRFPDFNLLLTRW